MSGPPKASLKEGGKDDVTKEWTTQASEKDTDNERIKKSMKENDKQTNDEPQEMDTMAQSISEQRTQDSIYQDVQPQERQTVEMSAKDTTCRSLQEKDEKMMEQETMSDHTQKCGIIKLDNSKKKKTSGGVDKTQNTLTTVKPPIIAEKHTVVRQDDDKRPQTEPKKDKAAEKAAPGNVAAKGEQKVNSQGSDPEGGQKKSSGSGGAEKKPSGITALLLHKNAGMERAELSLVRNKQLIEIATPIGQLGRRNIEDERYFHGYLSQDDVKRKLRTDGNFLVRKADWNDDEHYVISVMKHNSRLNFLIKQTKTKHLYWVFNYAFKTVVELIEYHYRNDEPIDESAVYLRIPVFRSQWQLSHEQIEILGQLGSGNFGTVNSGYLKKHPFEPPIKVAVKTLTQSDSTMSISEKNEFLREANLMLAIEHPNLVKLYGVASTRMPIQLVMELCDDTLVRRLDVHLHAFIFGHSEGLLTVTDKARLLCGAARGLEYLHSCHIIHRDIAARNCLIKDGHAKISDFGLSVIGGIKKSKLNNMPTRWCAPETLAQGAYSFHSDIFSFGALIYEIFSFGAVPYTDPLPVKQGALRNFIIYGGPAATRLHPTDPDTPLWIIELMDKCRQRDAYLRPLFPQVVKIIEENLGSKVPQLSLFVRIRERVQKFIIDMFAVAEEAKKEQDWMELKLNWLQQHSTYGEKKEWIDKYFAYRKDPRKLQ